MTKVRNRKEGDILPTPSMRDYISVKTINVEPRIDDPTTGEPFYTYASLMSEGKYGQNPIWAAATGDGTHAFCHNGRLCFSANATEMGKARSVTVYTWQEGDSDVKSYLLTPFAINAGYTTNMLYKASDYDIGTVYKSPYMFYTDYYRVENYYYKVFLKTNRPSINPAPEVTEPPVIQTSTIVVRVTSMPADQNDQGGVSDYMNGDGTFDDTTDKVPLPAMPTFSAAKSGMVSLFRPSLSEIQALGAYLWTNIKDFIENMQKLFSNPMDYFIAFHIVPAVPEVGSARNIKLGLWTTNISMAPVVSQWHEADMGEITIQPYWGSALDYAPYTKISLFLPFIGSVSLNTDEVMGQTLSLKYRIDLLSGQCVAILLVNNDALYQFTGECSVSIPLTGADWSRIYTAAVGAVTALAAGVAGGVAAGAKGATAGMSAANAMPSLPEATADIGAQAEKIASANVLRSKALLASHVSHTVDNVAGNIASAKPVVQHTGNISGSAGMLGNRTPYVLIEYPNQSLPENYKHFMGYPSNVYSNLTELNGYTECEQILLSGISCTEDELAEITEAMKAGVYL